MRRIIIVACVILSLSVIQVGSVYAYTQADCVFAASEWLLALAAAAVACSSCVVAPTPLNCATCIVLTAIAVEKESRAEYVCSHVDDE